MRHKQDRYGPEAWAIEAVMKGKSYGIGVFDDHGEAEDEVKSLERGGYEVHIWRL